MNPETALKAHTHIVSLELLPIDTEMLAALSPARIKTFNQRYNVETKQVMIDIVAVVDQTISNVLPFGGGGFLALKSGERQVVGTCGYPREPDTEGNIEIAYYCFKPFERQGIATSMAQSLVDRAIKMRAVRRVIAHTMSEHNASTRILQKLGFHHAGVMHDEKEGDFWRWERACTKVDALS